MSAVCPEGHTSQATDYCDICGAPMAASGGAAAGAVSESSGSGSSGAGDGTSAGPTTCPHCQAPAPAGALFCENCGYDFTTGTAPSSSSRFAAPGSSATPAPGSSAGSAQVLPAPPQKSRSALDLDPLEAPVAVAVDPVPGAGAGAGAGAGGSGESGDGEPAGGAGSEGAADPAADPAGDPEAAPASDPEAEPATNEVADPEATPAKGLPTPSVPGPDEWVAEVWIDPDWYAAQGPEDPIPSVGMPLVVPLRSRSVLVGRPSRSRGIHPDVDCGADTGVSRRQCQLSTDGLRWWVEDLQSANGTYISPVGEPLPTSPIPVGARQELEEGSRIFVGGWTRIVVRRGIPGEI